MKRIFMLVSLTVLSMLSAKAQDVSCQDLMDFVKQNGYRKGTVNTYQLTNSSWLTEVEAYSIENTIVVIAEIKQDEWGINTKEYVFCGIPSSNWDAFYHGLYDRDKTFGERFRKYIFEYKCNCN
jgi:hypothetical protein